MTYLCMAMFTDKRLFYWAEKLRKQVPIKTQMIKEYVIDKCVAYIFLTEIVSKKLEFCRQYTAQHKTRSANFVKEQDGERPSNQGTVVL